MSEALDLGSLTQWHRSGNDWFAFLGRYTFHGFHWFVQRDHNIEWAEHFAHQRRLRAYSLQKAASDV